MANEDKKEKVMTVDEAKTEEVLDAVKKEKALTETQQGWWDSIKGLEVNYYGLKDHFVESICSPLNVMPDSIFLNVKGPAVISLVTEALNTDRNCVKSASGKYLPRFILEAADKYVILKPNPDVVLKDYK